MEVLATDEAELDAQRARVARFIEDSLQMAGQVVTTPSDALEEFEILDHQLDAWNALWQARAEGETSALVTMATGLGKTSVGVFDVAKFREEFREDEGREPKVLFVCHQDKILEQAAKRFQSFIPDMSCGFYTGEEKDTEQDITFGTFQSLEKNLDEFDPFEFDYIIYDEAHHSQADTWRRVVQHFNPSFQLALTATPERMDGLEILDLFGREVYAKGLGEALAEGLLADIDYHIVFDEAVKTALEAGFHPSNLKELRELLAVPRRNDVIARNIREEMKKIGAEQAKTIIFCNDIAHCQVMAKLLGGKAYHSEMKKSERNDVLEDFREGDLQIICARDMFNEGIDIPEANLLVFLRSTQSKTVFEQQLGRGLRKRGDKQEVSVLDFVGNIKRLQELLDLSNAVSALAHEHDLDKIVSEGDQPRTGGGFKLHTSHASFDFNKMAVDILETYQSLVCEPAPEGYVSVDAFARELGVAYSTLKEIIAHHQIETERHKFFSIIGTSLSPDAQDYIRSLGGFLEEAPEGYLSAHAFAKEFGMSGPSLMKALQGHEIPLERYRHGAIGAISFSPGAQELVRNDPEILRLAPEGYVSFAAFCREIGVSEKAVLRQAEEHGIIVSQHRFRTSLAASLSPEAQSELRALDLPGDPVPEGFVSVTAFAKQLGTTYKTLRTRIEQVGVKPSRHNMGNGFAATLSPEDQEAIRATYPELPEAPEGYISMGAFRESIQGAGKAAILSAMEEHGIESERMLFKGREGEGLSAEAQRKLMEVLDIAPPIPEGYVSVSAFTKQIGTSRSKLDSVLEELGIETGRHRLRTHTVDSLSPEDQERIQAAYDQGVPAAPEGYLSLTAFSLEVGLKQKQLKALIEEQGIETGEFVFGKSRVGTGISPEDQDKIRSTLAASRAPDAPEDYMSVDGFAKAQGSHWNLVTQLIKENGIATGRHRFRGRPAVSLDPAAQQQLRSLLASRAAADAPEGYVTLSAFTRTDGIGKDKLNQLIEEAGIEPGVYKFGSHRGKGLSPGDQKKLRALRQS